MHSDWINASAGGGYFKDSWPASEWQTKKAESEKQMCVYVYVHVCECVFLHVWVSGLLGCIGILKSDWQGKSLLGEIVNRVEPVICSRQPWKGTPDSQGSYWEFQRCCLTDLGPSPCQTEPASCACSQNHVDQCAFTASILRSVCIFAAFFLREFLCSHISSSILSLFLFLLCQLCIFPQSTNCVFCSVLHFLIQQELHLYRAQLNPHN